MGERGGRRRSVGRNFLGVAFLSFETCLMISVTGCAGALDCPTRPEEVCVAAGSFVMGADPISFVSHYTSPSGGPCIPGSQATCVVDRSLGPRNDFAPRHSVELSRFIIQKTKVTNAAYGRCVDAGVCPVPQLSVGSVGSATDPAFAQAPVVGVPWSGARDYCVWNGGRLPTEAEYERVARGPGANGSTYPWGNSQPPSDFRQTGQPPFPNVGTNGFDVTPEGVRDLWTLPREWVQDWYDADYYSTPTAARDPAGPPLPTAGLKHCCADNSWRQHFVWRHAKSVRGVGFGNPSGGREWAATGQAAPAWFRDFANPSASYADIGFRCARDAQSTAVNPFPVYRDLQWRAMGPRGGQ